MSKWENFNKKTIQDNHCYCADNNGLFVSNRQLSAVVAGLLFLFFGYFIVGYFLGKRSSIEQFTQKMCQESFSDQIYTSVIAANNLDNIAFDASPKQMETHSVNEIENSNMTMAIDKGILVEVEDSQETLTKSLVATEEKNSTQYYAQLIGFSTEKAAQKFVQKLALKDVETFVKKRISKTAKGRVIYWYQVVTPPYDDKEALTLLVNRLAKEERLSGIYIGAC